MTPREFEDAVHKGKGRAVRWLLGNDPTPFAEIVLDACINCRQFDRQLEDNRVPYLLRLAELSDVVGRLLGKLASDYTGTAVGWDRSQRQDLLVALAQRGFRQARDTLSRAADLGAEDALEALAEVDLEGFRRFLTEYPDGWRHYPEIVWEDAVARFGEVETRQAITDSGVAFWEAATPSPSSIDPELSWQQLRDAIRSLTTNQRRVPGLLRFARTASDAEMIEAAEALLDETDPHRANQYARLFQRRPFPGDLDRAVVCANEDSPLGWAMRQALGAVTDARVRDLALRLTKTVGREGEGLELLERNCAPGDPERIWEMLSSVTERDPNELHRMVMPLVPLSRTLPDERMAAVLYWGYEQSPCSFCRYSIAREVLARGFATDEFRQELPFDAEEETRGLLGP